MSILLHVNVDHVATLRMARGTSYPDPCWAASLCELAGADGITVHLREDRRHIQDRDVELLRQTVRGTLNLEMAATPAMVDKALATQPDVVTLVPERRQERTTEGGLDLLGEALPAVQSAVVRLSQAGIPVSLFIAPDPAQLRAAAHLRVPRVELHTGAYCEATLHRGRAAEREKMAAAELERLAQAAEEGVSLKLHVAAGHGLDYNNVAAVAAIPGIDELNIGHALVARAVLVGLDRAVRDMIAILHAVA
jgi:pyridoxine 5-phosphate synthase